VEAGVVKKEKQEPAVKVPKVRVSKKGAGAAKREKGGRREVEVRLCTYIST
jgi:hypothetical protein